MDNNGMSVIKTVEDLVQTSYKLQYKKERVYLCCSIFLPRLDLNVGPHSVQVLKNPGKRVQTHLVFSPDLLIQIQMGVEELVIVFVPNFERVIIEETNNV